MKHFFLAAMLLVIASCSDKFDAVLRPVQEPLSSNKDTLRLREKDYTNILNSDAGKLTLYCADPSHQLNLLRDDTSQSVLVSYRGVSILSGGSIPVTDSVQLFVSADRPGLFPLRFLLTDRLGKTVEKTIIVYCVANQPAIASFFYRAEEQTQLQSWPYYFDASLSSKPDGAITAYHYSINGQLIDSRDPVLHWVFHAKGEQVITLYVTDDLGQNSDRYMQKILIP